MAHLLTGARKALLRAPVVTAPPPPAAISDPVWLGNARADVTPVNILTLTTGAASPAGAGLLVITLAQSIAGSFVVSDSGGNSYTEIHHNHGNAGQMRLFYCANAAAVANGGSITVDWEGDGRAWFIALSVVGLAAASMVDLQAGPITDPGSDVTTLSLASGTPSQASELMLGVNSVWGPTGTFNHGSGWTGVTQSADPGNLYSSLTVAWQKVTDGSAKTYAPTWTTADRAGQSVFSFKGA